MINNQIDLSSGIIIPHSYKNQDRLVTWNILPGMGNRVSTSKVLDDMFVVFYKVLSKMLQYVYMN